MAAKVPRPPAAVNLCRSPASDRSARGRVCTQSESRVGRRALAIVPRPYCCQPSQARAGTGHRAMRPAAARLARATGPCWPVGGDMRLTRSMWIALVVTSSTGCAWCAGKKPPVPCGGPAMACCANDACGPLLECRAHTCAPRSLPPPPPPCSQVGDACCPGAVCAPGLVCAGGQCAAPTVAPPCGPVGQACCPGDTCMLGARCEAGRCVVVPPIVMHLMCGLPGGPCCQDGGCGPGLRCDGQRCLVVMPVQIACGTLDHACCDSGPPCAPPLRCDQDRCRAPGQPITCGLRDQGCCTDGLACAPALTCQDGTCRLPAVPELNLPHVDSPHVDLPQDPPHVDLPRPGRPR